MSVLLGNPFIDGLSEDMFKKEEIDASVENLGWVKLVNIDMESCLWACFKGNMLLLPDAVSSLLAPPAPPVVLPLLPGAVPLPPSTPLFFD